MTHEFKRRGPLLAYAVAGLAFASACSGTPESAEVEPAEVETDPTAGENRNKVFEGTVQTGVFETPYGPQTLEYVLTPEGERVYQGDIRLPDPDDEPEYRAGGVSSYLKLWPNGIIPFEDNAASRENRVKEAIARWESRTNLRFVRGATTGSRLRFVTTSGTGCSSLVGRPSSGRQDVHIDTYCPIPSITHELGHAIGLFHEQMRTDREQFLNINRSCITPGLERNFDTFGSSGLNIGTYDFESYMGYGSDDSSKPGCNTLTKKDGSTFASQRRDLTGLDVSGVYALYQSWAPRNAVDYDGDQRADIAVWRADDRAGGISKWWISRSNGSGVTVPELGGPGDVPVPGDYNGNGIADIAVWRPSSGAWTVYPDGKIEGGFVRNWGVVGDIPVPADYDGDRKTDLAVWRPSDGLWYVILSRTNRSATAQLGEAGSIPLAGDNDNDGIADLTVFRPSDGLWLSQNTRDGVAFRTWGQWGDIPVPADYDGDGIRDRSVWRRGQWFVERSLDGVEEMKALGNSGDVPVPGDYDGDHKADRATWRPTDGTWRIILSGNGSVWTGTWGVLGDSAVP